MKLHIDPRKVVRGNVDDEDMATRLWAFWTTFTAVSLRSSVWVYDGVTLGIGCMVVCLYGAGV